MRQPAEGTQFNRQISLQITFIAIPCAIELSRSSFVHKFRAAVMPRGGQMDGIRRFEALVRGAQPRSFIKHD